jgi:hypothetical protein
MVSSRGILNIQSLNELTSENACLCGPRWEHTWRASAARYKHSVPNEFTSENGWLYK